MESYSKSITIQAPVDKVYDFSQVPANLPGLWPGVDKVSDVVPLPNGGTRFQIHAHFAGIPVLNGKRGCRSEAKSIRGEQDRRDGREHHDLVV